MQKANKIKSIEAFAIVDKDHPILRVADIYEDKTGVLTDKDEVFIKVVIREK